MWKNFITILGVFAAVCGGNSIPANARTGVSEGALCDNAALRAASETGVPVSVLMSIARVETGRTRDGVLRPWPWTINALGKGYFLETQQAALDFAARQIESGDINFDVGCFQVNLKWHSKGFTSLENAFDPETNALYAARFLISLLQEKGDWSGAVAAYHSRTENHAEDYLEKVKSVWRNLNEPPQPPARSGPARASIANYPLFRTGQGANGSLMPQITTDFPRFSLR